MQQRSNVTTGNIISNNTGNIDAVSLVTVDITGSNENTDF